MKNTKYQLQNFFIFDYARVEKRLDEMARKGWKLEKIGTMFWKYRRIEPTELIHSVIYVKSASDFNPHPTEEQMILEEYCETAGWEKICDWNKMNIYCTKSKDPVPLDTDEGLRLENMERSIKKSFLLGNFLLLGVFIMNTFMQGSLLFGKSSGMDLTKFNDRLTFVAFIFCLWGLLMEAGTIFLWYHWLRKSKRSVANGGSCFTTPFYLTYNQVCFVITTVLLGADILVLLGGTTSVYLLFFVLYFIGFFLILSGVKLTQKLLKKLEVSRKINIIITLIVDFTLAIAVIIFIHFIIF